MKLINKVKIFLLFERKMKLLLIEAFFHLGWARFLKSRPFSRIAPSLGEYMKETTLTMDESNIQILENVSQTINLMSRYTFWESMCLVKAMAAMKMLERRKIESTMYLGTAKDKNGTLIAHAWLRSGPFYITGAEVMEQFTVVSKFAKSSLKEIGHEPK